MKQNPLPFQIAKPCPKEWQDMNGDGKRRFCDHCQLHVHNLSATPAREQERLVEESGGKTCIAYELRPDGSPILWSRWRWLFRPFQRAQWAVVTLLATLMPFLFSSCATRRSVGELSPPHDAMHSDHKVGKMRRVLPGEMMPPPAHRDQ